MGTRYFKPVTPAEWQAFHRAAVTGNLSLFDFGQFFRATHTARNGRNLSEDECMSYIVAYAARIVSDAQNWLWFMHVHNDLFDELDREFLMLAHWQLERSFENETLQG